MTKQDLLSYCSGTYGTSPDYPFDEDFETAVLRHADNRKWYALVMRVSRRKFGFDSDEILDVSNLKLPVELSCSFGKGNGVDPAYHMNKLNLISVILSDATEETIAFLTNVSYKAIKANPRRETAGLSRRRKASLNIFGILGKRRC